MSLLEKFLSTRNYTEQLCAPLNIEDYIVQIATFTSPAKWHIAHTTWFFEEFVLKTYQKDYTHFDDDFNFIFNSYYNNSGKRISRSDRGYLTRPTVERIYEYRKYVTEAIQIYLEGNPDEKAIELITLGINHEEQHQELLITDLKFMFASNPLHPIYDAKFDIINSKNTETGFASVQEGVYEIGYQGNDFCYDNELGRHKVYLNDFEISKSLVTNGEYLEFMEAGGYEDFNFWLEEGLHWKAKNNINSPLYWEKINGVWYQFTLAGMKKVDPDQILTHISYYEASAFAEWKSMRLPTEAEWEIASQQFDWGQRWEWTNSAYLAYPNFKKSEGAVGEYNGKFMDKQKVLRGASVATSKNHSRPTYRNFFYSEERWQFTGLRLVK
ncbi:ergothioneine biosynthesis protein EgtB [Brumimicrobium aurantiacum]|uniref:Ergothioneine biosynthesis protein EgtB n=1 Tax=Brumimicrobium aurantiacum TaxID=1737063 RepID=A0A3E1F1F1_9FLAO|nr:ergothioneine biosynthesis protein EgtB [Brumimicrobium aurantiacum]RFC55635.1 ergothioneine biosynthesis protein EgtB [Brumimicrobium aurantiacum]